jgi:tetratricopeptide (TPR) repeat protein
MQRQEQSAAIAEINRRAESEPDLDKKHNIIKEACERFPNEPHFKSSLKLIRDRRDLVNSIVARAKQYEERGQFAESANQWDILRNIYPVYPGLEFELERLNRRRQENAHAEAKAHWMERIDGYFATGEYSKARDSIREALADFPNDKELEGLESLADQGIRRSAEATLLLTQGRDLCSAKKYTDGLDALRKAERLDPRNASARATLLSCLVEHARELISKDWTVAEPLIQEASAISAATIWRALSRRYRMVWPSIQTRCVWLNSRTLFGPLPHPNMIWAPQLPAHSKANSRLPLCPNLKLRKLPPQA